jgi:hypothetical protein
MVRGLLKRVITEPGVETAQDYARRVRILAATHCRLRPWETARAEARLEGARGDEQVEVELDYPVR